MRCSDCARPIKPVVAIDIDGTLGDYHGHFQEFAEQYLQCDPCGPYRGGESHGSWFCRTYQTDMRTFRDIKLAYRQGGMKRSMPAYLHADALVASLRDTGAEVWLTTTRPYLRLDKTDPDTRFWLAHNRIGYDGLLYDEDKYTVLADIVEPGRVVGVLDDLPEMIDAARRLFGAATALLRRNGYNDESINDAMRSSPGWIIVEGFSEAATILGSRIVAWREHHA